MHSKVLGAGTRSSLSPIGHIIMNNATTIKAIVNVVNAWQDVSAAIMKMPKCPICGYSTVYIKDYGHDPFCACSRLGDGVLELKIESGAF